MTNTSIKSSTIIVTTEDGEKIQVNVVLPVISEPKRDLNAWEKSSNK